VGDPLKKTKFDAVIFDWDGTLAATKNVIVSSFQSVLKELGCSVSNEPIERRIGIGAGNTFRELLSLCGMPFSDEMIRDLVDRKVNAELELSDSVRLFDGATELLSAVQGKKKTALATMNNRRIIDRMLNERNLTRFFSVVVTADEVVNAKPNPEIFLDCASKLESEPRRCVVVEDSLFGVKAAKNAEMKCIAVATGVYTKKELEAEKPDLIANSLKENTVLKFIMS
jgi:HAD superfamily hydrolase (TIGR01509 family)